MGEAVSSLKEVALWAGLVRIRRLKIITSSTEQTRAWIFQKDRRCLLADVNLLMINHAKKVWIAHISFSLKDTFVGTLWDQEST